ncbi:MAG: hypothetical protein C5B49_09115 [Bdellovibrio sp.]|nr:MAG: hypothetical protein C5B49_09115 [Bdellovibrio sp.]
MKNKGLWIFGALTAVAVSAAVFDFQWEKKTEEKKTEDSIVFKDFKPDQCVSLELTTANPASLVKDGTPVLENTVVLKKEKDEWWIKSPIEELADQAAVRSFLEGLPAEKATEIAALGQKEAEWETFGLDKPKGSIRVTNQGGGTTEISVSGRKNFQGEAYLRRNREDKPLLGSSTWHTKMEKSLFDFRDKRLLQAKTEDVRKLAVRAHDVRRGSAAHDGSGSAAPVVLEFRDGVWFLPAKPKWKIDQGQVREILDKLTMGSLTSIQKEGQLKSEDTKEFAKPSATIEVTLSSTGSKADAKIWTAQLVSGKDKDSSHDSTNSNANTKIRTSNPSRIGTISNSDAEKLTKFSEDQLRDKASPFDFKKADVHKVEIKMADQVLQAEKSDNDWKVVAKSDPQLNVDAKKIAAVLDRVQSLEAVEFMPRGEAPGKTQNSISVKDSSGKSLVDLVFGETQKKKINGVDRSVVLAKSNLVDEIVAVDASKVKDLGVEEIFPAKKEDVKEKANSNASASANANAKKDEAKKDEAKTH